MNGNLLIDSLATANIFNDYRYLTSTGRPAEIVANSNQADPLKSPPLPPFRRCFFNNPDVDQSSARREPSKTCQLPA
jgi:hypothetical protein